MSKALAKKEINPFKKEFDNFFDSPTRGKLEGFLQNHFGEQPECDFKESWQALGKLPRHILAIANSGGGCIIVGIAETKSGLLEIKGLTDFLDKTKIIDSLKKYLPSSLIFNIAIHNFGYDDDSGKLKGKKFQVIIIEDKPGLFPFVAERDGEQLREGAIYIRRGTSSVEANYTEVQKIINRRIETGYSSQAELDLNSHIEQLSFLYGLIKKGEVVPTANLFGKELVEKVADFGKKLAANFTVIPNPSYPEEEVDEFIAKLIKKKKKKIEIELGIEGISD